MSSNSVMEQLQIKIPLEVNVGVQEAPEFS